MSIPQRTRKKDLVFLVSYGKDVRLNLNNAQFDNSPRKS